VLSSINLISHASDKIGMDMFYSNLPLAPLPLVAPPQLDLWESPTKVDHSFDAFEDLVSLFALPTPEIPKKAIETTAPANLSRAELQDLTKQIASQHGIPETIFFNQIKQESNFNPRALSRSGAVGLGQLMPATAKELGVADPLNPIDNLNGAARYLKQQYDHFGSWPLALAAYNAGPGNVRHFNGIPPFAETQHYVATILTQSQS
jgi:soluble lytic murein transglycosylase-like protein